VIVSEYLTMDELAKLTEALLASKPIVADDGSSWWVVSVCPTLPPVVGSKGTNPHILTEVVIKQESGPRNALLPFKKEG
jgi:hypothetical protein